MMKTQLTIFLLLLAGATHGQKYFEATLGRSLVGDYELLKPLFKHESFDTTGKVSTIYLFTEGVYFKTLFNKSMESVLPIDSINRLTTFSGGSTHSMAIIRIDPTGKIWNISFSIPIEERKILTDEVLYRLYQKISEMKVDMSKIKIEPAGVPDKDTYGTHAMFLYTWPKKGK